MPTDEQARQTQLHELTDGPAYEFAYRYVKTKDGREAFDLEREIQKHGLGGKLSELNPAKRS